MSKTFEDELDAPDEKSFDSFKSAFFADDDDDDDSSEEWGGGSSWGIPTRSPEQNWREFLREYDIDDYEDQVAALGKHSPGTPAFDAAFDELLDIWTKALNSEDSPKPSPGGRDRVPAEERWSEKSSQALHAAIQRCYYWDEDDVVKLRKRLDFLRTLLTAEHPVVASLERELAAALERYDEPTVEEVIASATASLHTYLQRGSGDLSPVVERMEALADQVYEASRALDDLIVRADEAPAELDPAHLDEAYARLKSEGTPITRGFMARLVKARFGIDKLSFYRDEDKDEKLKKEGKGRSVTRIYEILSNLPESHTRDNDSFKSIVRYGKKVGFKGGSYDSTKKKLVLQCASVTTDSTKVMCSPKQLPEVEPDCQPVDPDNEVNHFDWVVLHEVGHSVDDKFEFMAKRMNTEQFGSWEKLEKADVAKQIATAFGCDPLFAQDLLNESSTAPEPEPNSDEAANRELAKSWFDGHRHDKHAYNTRAVTDADHDRFGDSVLHEAYKGRWYRYAYSARQQGLSGYQFRAPGEWFAELYAAYHSNKLKPTHPAVQGGKGWLATLESTAMAPVE